MLAGEPREDDPGVRDRSGRLAFFGVITIMFGGLAALFGLASLVLPFAATAMLGDGAPPADPAGAVMGFLTYTLIGAAMVWAGTGSLRRRRWAPPVMQTLAWTWLLLGLILIPLLFVVLDDAMLLAASSTGPLPPGVATGLKLVLLGAVGLFGVLVPGIYILAFRDPRMLQTCRRHDPSPDWSERCPRPVLALSLLLWATAALTAPLALRPIVPLFGKLVTGGWGLMLTLAGAGVSAWLARGIYRLSMAAWWATTALMLVGGLSTALTAWQIDPVELYAASGIPPDQLAGVEGLGSNLLVAGAWGTLALTALSLVYMLAIRRHFRTAGDEAQT